eukprot:NODE_331_length_10750_cov_0.204676.p3 type:complete len:233 gc:universal NODE_331_length_10750_cov_0.204676:3957-3259(-)
MKFFSIVIRSAEKTSSYERQAAATVVRQYRREVSDLQLWASSKFCPGGAGTNMTSRTIFIGQLPFSATKEEIEEILDCEVENIKLPRNFRTGRPKGIAFVTFANRSDLENVLTQKFELSGRELVLKEASDEAPEPPMPKEQSNSLFVGNLPYSCSEVELAGFFPGCIDAIVCTRRDGGDSLGYGYVHFNTVEEAIEAFKSKKGAVLDNRHLRLDFDIAKGGRRKREKAPEVQ